MLISIFKIIEDNKWYLYKFWGVIFIECEKFNSHKKRIEQGAKKVKDKNKNNCI